jgi:hypothetical protein
MVSPRSWRWLRIGRRRVPAACQPVTSAGRGADGGRVRCTGCPIRRSGSSRDPEDLGRPRSQNPSKSRRACRPRLGQRDSLLFAHNQISTGGGDGRAASNPHSLHIERWDHDHPRRRTRAVRLRERPVVPGWVVPTAPGNAMVHRVAHRASQRNQDGLQRPFHPRGRRTPSDRQAGARSGRVSSSINLSGRYSHAPAS